MARYFAEIKDNIVQRVIVADSAKWCKDHLGGEWIETFMDSNDKNYAGRGHLYYPDKNNFGTLKPFPSWNLKKDLSWEAPKAMPEVSLGTVSMFSWNEDILDWENKNGQ